jgi:hypothetical protein
MPHIALLPRYLCGLAATLAGAAATELTGSLMPLALGASFTLICTAGVVRRIRAAARKSR